MGRGVVSDIYLNDTHPANQFIFWTTYFEIVDRNESEARTFFAHNFQFEWEIIPFC